MFEIIKHPDPFLSKVIKPVDDFKDLNQLVEHMLEVMYAGEGVGLAAPQVGVDKRIVLIDQSSGESAKSLRVLINPVITSMSPEKIRDTEGCLSLPGMKFSVLRSKLISIEFFDLQGNKHSELLAGLESRIAQHEIDHLDGITLLQRAKAR